MRSVTHSEIKETLEQMGFESVEIEAIDPYYPENEDQKSGDIIEVGHGDYVEKGILIHGPAYGLMIAWFTETPSNPTLRESIEEAFDEATEITTETIQDESDTPWTTSQNDAKRPVSSFLECKSPHTTETATEWIKMLGYEHYQYEVTEIERVDLRFYGASAYRSLGPDRFEVDYNGNIRIGIVLDDFISGYTIAWVKSPQPTADSDNDRPEPETAEFNAAENTELATYKPKTIKNLPDVWGEVDFFLAGKPESETASRFCMDQEETPSKGLLITLSCKGVDFDMVVHRPISGAKDCWKVSEYRTGRSLSNVYEDTRQEAIYSAMRKMATGNPETIKNSIDESAINPPLAKPEQETVAQPTETPTPTPTQDAKSVAPDESDEQSETTGHPFKPRTIKCLPDVWGEVELNLYDTLKVGEDKKAPAKGLLMTLPCGDVEFDFVLHRPIGRDKGWDISEYHTGLCLPRIYGDTRQDAIEEAKEVLKTKDPKLIQERIQSESINPPLAKPKSTEADTIKGVLEKIGFQDVEVKVSFNSTLKAEETTTPDETEPKSNRLPTLDEVVEEMGIPNIPDAPNSVEKALQIEGQIAVIDQMARRFPIDAPTVQITELGFDREEYIKRASGIQHALKVVMSIRESRMEEVFERDWETLTPFQQDRFMKIRLPDNPRTEAQMIASLQNELSFC